jgi:tetrapyrrole methylase family protein/MazG family protein
MSGARKSPNQSPAVPDQIPPGQGAFAELCEVIARLRAPDGCPWDREQSPATLRGDLIEETYECVEAIDEKDPAHIREELGDLYLLVTMLAYMHQQENLFTVEDTLRGIVEKLIRRHPHVFGETQVKDSAEVLENWGKIKVELEGRKPRDGVLDGVSRGLPPLDRAFKLQKKAAKAGFDWPERQGPIAKLREELAETEAALGILDREGPEIPENREALEGELGDLLFSAVNLCRFLKVDPSVALQRTNVKFEKRFKYVEKKMKENGLALSGENLARMDGYWEEAKGEA